MIEIEINEFKLKVYENGEIEYFYKKNWRKASNVLDKGYKSIRFNGKNYRQHRIVYFAFHQDWNINNPKLLIDHINRVKDDNRLENLRAVSNQQNAFNRSNVKGYTFEADRGKWKGQIGINGKQITKYFDTEIEARDWHLEQKKILHII